MLVYQVRPRRFRVQDGATPSFPADCIVRFRMQPLQPFGRQGDGGRTVVQSKPAEMLMDLNTGVHSAVSSEPLEPLNVVIQWPDGTWTLRGNVLELKQRFESRLDFSNAIGSVYYVVPALLAIEFGDPPYIVQVEGAIGAVPFSWELNGWRFDVTVTNQEHQEALAARALEGITLVAEVRRRRLLAAIHYFHVACRLERVSQTPGEFLPEVLLNLSKVLEALFPGEQSIDAARSGLRTLGFSHHQIEGQYVPAIALRNAVDVGHVKLELLETSDAAVIHAYADKAEGYFRELLQRVLESTRVGEYEAMSYTPAVEQTEVRRVVQRMSAYMHGDDYRADTEGA